MSMRYFWPAALLSLALAPAGCAPPSTSVAERTQGITEPGASIHTRPVCTEGRWRCTAVKLADEEGKTLRAGPSSGYGPSDLAKAYDFDPTIDPNATVAIVIAYGYPNAESDLAVYRKQFNLPPCTVANGCLQLLNEDGKTSPIPPSDAKWNEEAALDLQMVSAVCPKCKIMLLQTTLGETEPGLFKAQEVAAKLGATVISNSWGGADDDPKDPGSNYEHYFNVSTGVGIFAGTGDTGWNTKAFYPSVSAHVIAVGGTSLSGGRESAWAKAGSSCSENIDKPSYQPDTGCAKRAAADVSAVADLSTPVVIYYQGQWEPIGGTSVATPIVAAMFALTGHGGSKADFVYAHPEAFVDVTSGSNGGSGKLGNAGPGWDGPTGLGSPRGSKLLKIAPNPPVPPDMGPASDMNPPSDMGSNQDMKSPADMKGSGGDDMSEPSPTPDMKSGPNPPQPPAGGCALAGAAGADTAAPLLLLLLAAVPLALRRRLG